MKFSGPVFHVFNHPAYVPVLLLISFLTLNRLVLALAGGIKLIAFKKWNPLCIQKNLLYISPGFYILFLPKFISLIKQNKILVYDTIFT